MRLPMKASMTKKSIILQQIGYRFAYVLLNTLVFECENEGAFKIF